jgi:hypothetical protein
MIKVIIGCIIFEHQLNLRWNLLIYNDSQSNRCWKSWVTLNLYDSVLIFWFLILLLNKSVYAIDRTNNICDVDKNALNMEHIANSKMYMWCGYKIILNTI